MSDTTDHPKPAPQPITVTLELPARVVMHYDLMTEAGLYLSTEEALRQAILNSLRFEKGSHLSLRLDADAGEDKHADKAEMSEEPSSTFEA
ncbi:hypothetical protein [Rubellimicrobium arenae]|uniref:hypothetical protein n=1 Tax=Rubellimicrobium arenae TaxID=2817372 RepID=UPI001B3056DD|nr:hypothetical protein [Rubellimicrobium arenae]